MGSMKVLEPLRREIDAIDDQIVALLARRRDAVLRVVEVKRVHGIPARIPERIEQVKDRNAAHAAALGLDPDLVRRLFDLLIEEACAAEEKLLGDTTTVA